MKCFILCKCETQGAVAILTALEESRPQPYDTLVCLEQKGHVISTLVELPSFGYIPKKLRFHVLINCLTPFKGISD